MFKNVYQKPEHFFSESGEGTRKTYKAVLAKNGNIELEEDGIEDIYAYIQSFKESVDINNILYRFTNGELGALGEESGFYGDFVNVPSSYIDILNSIVELRNTYETDGSIDKSKITFESYYNDLINKLVNPAPKVEEKKENENEQKSE